MDAKSYPKTIVCDIDGCVLQHHGTLGDITKGPAKLLPGVEKMFNEWNDHSCFIVLLTGRKESARQFTETQLREVGLFWDVLIMGATRGERILVNDKKPSGYHTARAINLDRNKGMQDIDMHWPIASVDD